MILSIGMLLPFSYHHGWGIPTVWADGDGGDGGDGDGDGDDGGDDDGSDGGSDGGSDAGGGDGSDGGDEWDGEEYLEWLSEGLNSAGVTTFQQQDERAWISEEEEHALIASQWNHPVSQRYAVATRHAEPVDPIPIQKIEVESSVFPQDRLQLSYRRLVEQSDDDIAVIIGNANYSQFGAEVPDVVPAYADAEAFSRFAREGLGVREGNIIQLQDATQAQMMRLFGTAEHPQGQLYDWVKRDRSRVYLYFSGHGAPGPQQASNYLVPADADGARLALNGYPLGQLYQNLAALDARSVTVVLEACFSGLSQESQVVTHASPIFVRKRPKLVPEEITVIAAGAAEQIASWEQDRSHGLFTKYYLHAMSGEADREPYGNGDEIVELDEVDRYLKDTLTYWARRYYGREQVAQIHQGERDE